MEPVTCNICSASVQVDDWANHVQMHTSADSVVGGSADQKRVNHVANAYEGISEADRRAMTQLKNVRERQKQFIESIRRGGRLGPSAAEIFGMDPPAAPTYQAPIQQAPAPVQQVVYLCGNCQGQMVPGVQHVCAQAPVVVNRPIVTDGRNPLAR